MKLISLKVRDVRTFGVQKNLEWPIQIRSHTTGISLFLSSRHRSLFLSLYLFLFSKMKDGMPKEMMSIDISHWLPPNMEGIPILQKKLSHFIQKRLNFNPKVTSTTVLNEIRAIVDYLHAPSDMFDAVRSFILSHGTDHIWCITRNGIPRTNTIMKRLMAGKKSPPDHVEGFVTLRPIMKDIAETLLRSGSQNYSMGVWKVDIRQLKGVAFHDLGSAPFWGKLTQYVDLFIVTFEIVNVHTYRDKMKDRIVECLSESPLLTQRCDETHFNLWNVFSNPIP